MSICEICGKEYIYSCSSCTRRVATWGIDGTLELIRLATSNNDINSDAIVPFVQKYYIGKSKTNSDKANVFRTALRVLGYTGKFIGKIRKTKYDYIYIRKRKNQEARRWRLRKDTCTVCGSSENLRIHHVVPLSWGGESTEENVVTLCEKHHRETHRRLSTLLDRGLLIEYIKPYAEEIKRKALSSIM